MKQMELLEKLSTDTKNHLTRAEALLDLDLKQLNNRKDETSWNALECIEHLNLYGDFYNNELKRIILKGKKAEGSREFKPGYFGKKFTTMMQPIEKGAKPIKTFKSKNPIGSSLGQQTIHKFINQQIELIELLEKAKYLDLNKNKCKLTLPLLKMSLGDTFGFYIAHINRHLNQAEKAILN